MKNTKLNKTVIIIIFSICIIISCLSGCTENDNQDENSIDRFIGTWTGNLIIKSGTDITEFKFEDNTVDVKTEGNWGKDKDYFIETFYYEIQGNDLVLESSSEKDGKTSSTVYSYSFNDGYDVLYIDGSAFTKN